MGSTTIHPPEGRGCGERVEGGGYLCTGTSKDGLPIEHFVIDPVRVWDGPWIRGMKIIPRDPTSPSSINDLLVFVGREHYASPWAFVREVAQYGASRRFSPTLPFEQLTPGKTKMVFVHRFAYPLFEFKPSEFAEYKHCKRRGEDNRLPKDGLHADGTPCAFALQDLALFVEKNAEVIDVLHFADPDTFSVSYPSFHWVGYVPASPTAAPEESEWAMGAFLALPLTHVEFCKVKDEAVAYRAQRAGYRVEVLEY